MTRMMVVGRTSFLFLSLSLVVGCHGGGGGNNDGAATDASQSGSDASQSGSDASQSGSDAGQSGSDAGAANPLFVTIFGGDDGAILGRTCSGTQADKCRGSAHLYVCPAAGATCAKCSSDAECIDEYPSLNDADYDYVVCRSDGTCGFPTTPIGGCGNSDVPTQAACGVASGGPGAGAHFVCVSGQCSACTETTQCALYGPEWQCQPPIAPVPGSPYSCVESLGG